MQSVSNLFIALQVLVVCTMISSQVFGVEPNNIPFDYKDYAKVLKDYVDDTGMVNYKKLKTKPNELDAFVTAMGELDPNCLAK